MFTIWPHGEECFESFIEQINSMHSTIKFTTEWSYRSVSFLDVKITLNEEGRLITDLYTKPTDTHHYLHRQSCYRIIIYTVHVTVKLPYCLQSSPPSPTNLLSGVGDSIQTYDHLFTSVGDSLFPLRMVITFPALD